MKVQERREALAPRARASGLACARMRHRFTSAKAPHGERAERLADAPRQPPQPSSPRASCRIERPRTPRVSRSRVGSVHVRRPAITRGAPSRTRTAYRAPTSVERDELSLTHRGHLTQRHHPIGGRADIRDASPATSLRRVLPKHQTVTPHVWQRHQNWRQCAVLHAKVTRNIPMSPPRGIVWRQSPAERNRGIKCLATQHCLRVSATY
jgi:hypothetical protein